MKSENITTKRVDELGYVLEWIHGVDSNKLFTLN